MSRARLEAEVRRRPSRRWAGVLGVGVLLALLLVLGATRDLRGRAWIDRCEARGGAIQILPPEPDNPLLAQSDEPGLRCVAADGTVIAVRR